MYVVWILTSLVLSLPACLVRWQEPLFRLGNDANVTLAHLVIVFQWASLIIPLLYNGLQWQRRLRKIRSNWKQKKDLRMTFLGRPGDISAWEQAQMEERTPRARTRRARRTLDKDLRTFVVKTGDPKKPKIVLNPDILSPEAMTTTYAEA